MMNPADHTQLTASQRPAEPPTLWLSLTLGSVLIHLVLFTLASIISTQTAKVQVDLEPVAVEFVESAATVQPIVPNPAIAARPGPPSATQPSSTPIQANEPPRSSSLNQPVEQPFVPPPPVKRKPLPVRPQQPQPSFSQPQPRPQPQPDIPDPPQPGTPNIPLPQQRNPIQPPQPQPSNNLPQGGLSQGGLPGDSSGNGSQQPSDQQEPKESGTQIAQSPGGGSVSVVVSNPRQVDFDRQQQPARPIGQEKTVLIRYPAAAAQIPGGSIKLEVPLVIDDKGLFIETGEIKLLFPTNLSLDQADLKSIANQIFATWSFEPAQNGSGSALQKPRISNLIIDAQVQFR